MATSRLTRPYTPCQWTAGCRHPAYTTVEITTDTPGRYNYIPACMVCVRDCNVLGSTKEFVML